MKNKIIAFILASILLLFSVSFNSFAALENDVDFGELNINVAIIGEVKKEDNIKDTFSYGSSEPT